MKNSLYVFTFVLFNLIFIQVKANGVSVFIDLLSVGITEDESESTGKNMLDTLYNGLKFEFRGKGGLREQLDKEETYTLIDSGIDIKTSKACADIFLIMEAPEVIGLSPSVVNQMNSYYWSYECHKKFSMIKKDDADEFSTENFKIK